MIYRRTLCSAALGATLATAAPAWAQAPAAPPEASNAQADDLTHRGVDLIKKHQWAEAEALLRQAWALRHAYDIAGNLGLAETGLGKWREASEHLAFALATFPANGKAAHRELLREKLVKVREELGALTVVVGAAGVGGVGAEVVVDGKRVGTAPLGEAVFVDPGSHTVEARLAGYETARQGVEAVKGGALTVTLGMVGVREAPVVVVPTVTPERRSRAPGIVLGSVAGVSLATGIALVVVAASKTSTVQDEYNAIKKAGHSCVVGASNFDPQCNGLHSTASSGDTLHNAGVGLLAVAGAAAVGAVLYIVWPPASAAAPRVSAVRVTPAASPTGLGLLFSATF